MKSESTLPDSWLLDELRRLRSVVGHYPSRLDVEREGRCSPAPYRDRWKSVRLARVAAGMHPPVEPTVERYLIDAVSGNDGVAYVRSDRVARDLGFDKHEDDYRSTYRVGIAIRSIADRAETDDSLKLSIEKFSGSNPVVWRVEAT